MREAEKNVLMCHLWMDQKGTIRQGRTFGHTRIFQGSCRSFDCGLIKAFNKRQEPPTLSFLRPLPPKHIFEVNILPSAVELFVTILSSRQTYEKYNYNDNDNRHLISPEMMPQMVPNVVLEYHRLSSYHFNEGLHISTTHSQSLSDPNEVS